MTAAACLEIMAHGFGTQQKGSLNVELNLVPFIDLMSCLTAFLLVAAVWVNTANLRNDPASHGNVKVDEEPPRLAMLVEYDQIVITQFPSGEAHAVGPADWDRVETTLRGLQGAGDPTMHVEIAAASTALHPIAYQTLIAAMDTAVKAGFPDVCVTDPQTMR